jgi:GxxExxY protein
MVTTEAQKHRRGDRGGEITGEVIRAAIEVHKQLGPGLLEGMYEECLCRELTLMHVAFERQVPLKLEYKGLAVGAAYRMDLVVEGSVVVEIKAVEALLPVHRAQLLTYLRLSKCPLGLLVNFNVAVIPNGIVRLALLRSVLLW